MIQKSIIAFDIGATKIAYGIVQFKIQRSKLKTKIKNSKACPRESSGVKNLDFEIQSFNKIKTPKSRKEIIKKIINIVKEFFEDKKIDKIGIGMAGQMDFEKGKVLSSLVANGWKNVPLKKILEKELKVPVSLNNDAHSFVMAEAKFGAAKNYQNIIGLTLGTKIGGGIIIGGKLYRGANNIAGEFTYTIRANKSLKIPIKELKKELKQPCNKIGYHYLGEWTAGKGIEKLYKELTDKDLTAFEIEKRALKGEKAALKIINLSAESLGCELANIINFLNPEIIVIGGGLSRMDILWKPMIQEAKKRVFFPPLAKTKIVKSKLGDEAGVLGAAVLAID